MPETRGTYDNMLHTRDLEQIEAGAAEHYNCWYCTGI